MDVLEKIVIGVVIAFVVIVSGVVGALFLIPPSNPGAGDNTGGNPNPLPSKYIMVNWTQKLTTRVVFGSVAYYLQNTSALRYLVINVTIINHGYNDFSTDPYYFHAVIDNITYDYNYMITDSSSWQTVSINNGGVFTGQSLVFKVPKDAQNIALEIDENYNIIYNAK